MHEPGSSVWGRAGRGCERARRQHGWAVWGMRACEQWRACERWRMSGSGWAMAEKQTASTYHCEGEQEKWRSQIVTRLTHSFSVSLYLYLRDARRHTAGGSHRSQTHRQRMGRRVEAPWPCKKSNNIFITIQSVCVCVCLAVLWGQHFSFG